ncbi:unnamed protein product [Caenorhabditis brenneri]
MPVKDGFKILFTSELLGDDHARPREVLQEDIKKYLNDQIRDAVDEDDKAIAAILMIYNLNKTQTREAAVDIIAKICSNILENPDVERMLTLRSKEMREKDELNATKKYKYTLIRVRLPGNILIQSVFGCSEPFSNVRLFVASTLSSALVASEFTLRDATGQFVEDENTSLVQLGLVPAALLHMVFTEPIEGAGDVVADEYLDQILELE